MLRRRRARRRAHPRVGIKGPGGEPPILDGEKATTRKELQFPFDGQQVRGLIIVGWRRSDLWQVGPRSTS
ncbi:MAG: hypothetical protein IPG04_15185 [Polyangiaceae bacterium]|nr:hypothetical protein [Polyangiaceae bacterium]